MKTKKKVIQDNIGSTSQMRAVVREALWGIVEKLSREELVDAEIDTIQVEDLPMQFSSNRKRKNGKEARNSNKKHQVSSGIQLPVPRYNGTLLEENVYLVGTHDVHKDMVIRVVGVGSLHVSHTVVARLIGRIGEDCGAECGTTTQINRKALLTIPAHDRNNAHKLVQLDEQRILQVGMPAEVHLKYWDQRYRLMRLYDNGVKLDAESWFSITPEAVAKHVTSSCIGRARELGCRLEKVLDCFSGCGGNTIPFAQLGKPVVSVDFDPHKLENLRHNCMVYDVKAEVNSVCADVYSLLEALTAPSQLASIMDRYDNILKADDQTSTSDAEVAPVESDESAAGKDALSGGIGGKNNTSVSKQEAPCSATILANSAETHITSTKAITADQLALCNDADLIILSPPWGGPDYLYADTYCLYTMLTCGCGLYLCMLAAAVSPNLLLLLPVNTSQQQIADIAAVLHMPFVIEYVHINNSPKLMAVYMGEIVNHARKHEQKLKEVARQDGTFAGKGSHIVFEDL